MSVPKEVASTLRTLMRMALPNSRLMRVSTSDKVGFLGTSASIGSSKRAASVDCNLAFFMLFSLYPSTLTLTSPVVLDSMFMLMLMLLFYLVSVSHGLSLRLVYLLTLSAWISRKQRMDLRFSLKAWFHSSSCFYYPGPMLGNTDPYSGLIFFFFF